MPLSTWQWFIQKYCSIIILVLNEFPNHILILHKKKKRDTYSELGTLLWCCQKGMRTTLSLSLFYLIGLYQVKEGRTIWSQLQKQDYSLLDQHVKSPYWSEWLMDKCSKIKCNVFLCKIRRKQHFILDLSVSVLLSVSVSVFLFFFVSHVIYRNQKNGINNAGLEGIETFRDVVPGANSGI